MTNNPHANYPVRVTDVQKRFGRLEVLKGVSLSVQRGEVVVIMGPSGSGKTTLIRCMNLLAEPDSGTVQVCGRDIDCGAGRRGRARAEALREIRSKAAMVFQQFNLFPHMTALENVIEGPLSVRRIPRVDAVALGERLLRRVGLSDKRDVHPSRLSGGQCQRVAIARAMAMEPEVILFDEPTSALDPELHLEVLQVIHELANDGMTLVVVTHEIEFAREVADRVVFMDGGHILEVAPPKEFFARPQHERAQTFLRLVSHTTTDPNQSTAEAPLPEELHRA